jgi:hypothetical protein
MEHPAAWLPDDDDKADELLNIVEHAAKRIEALGINPPSVPACSTLFAALLNIMAEGCCQEHARAFRRDLRRWCEAQERQGLN